MDDVTLQKIALLIQQKAEGDYWDYKQEWHSDNERLLHDILCFSNTIHDKDCYLIIGVSDNGEIIGLTSESPHRKSQTMVLDLLYNTAFAGDYTPKVSVESIQMQEKEIDILTIYNSYNVPFYLKKKPDRYRSIVPGYIYSRIGDRNTPINQNSNIQQIEMLWKKRLGLLNPPLKQIILNLKSKSEWAQEEDTYFYINNPDFKIEEGRRTDTGGNWRPDRPEFYSYNQMNIRTSYVELSAIYRQTVLRRIDVVILDSGRYMTPVPDWAFIHDSSRHLEVLYSYKYILKDSLEYAIQQFLYDDKNGDAVEAKRRFDEVVLYFENAVEQQEFHNHIEKKPEIVSDYIADAALGTYVIESENPFEKQDATKKLIVAFAFKRYLFDYRRSNSGVTVRRIASIQLISRRPSAYCSDIFEHRLTVNASGYIHHSMYAKDDSKARIRYVYHSTKYWTRDFLNYIEPISTDWENDYIIEGCDQDEWECIIKYTDGIKKIIKGNTPPPNYDTVEWRIAHLARYKVKPWIFGTYG